MLGNIVYQLRVANGGRVNGNFVGTGIEQAVYVTQFVDPSPDSKRNTDIGSYSPNKLGKVLRPSWLAVMSRKTNSSAPCSL